MIIINFSKILKSWEPIVETNKKWNSNLKKIVVENSLLSKGPTWYCSNFKEKQLTLVCKLPETDTEIPANANHISPSECVYMNKSLSYQYIYSLFHIHTYLQNLQNSNCLIDLKPNLKLSTLNNTSPEPFYTFFVNTHLCTFSFLFDC